MNGQPSNQPIKKLAIKEQSIAVLSAPSAEQRFPTFDC